MSNTWAKANEVARQAQRTPQWVHLRARQGKIRRKRSEGRLLYNIEDALATREDNQPAEHASAKRDMRRILWVIEGFEFNEIPGEKALQMIAQIARGVV